LFYTRNAAAVEEQDLNHQLQKSENFTVFTHSSYSRPITFIKKEILRRLLLFFQSEVWRCLWRSCATWIHDPDEGDFTSKDDCSRSIFVLQVARYCLGRCYVKVYSTSKGKFKNDIMKLHKDINNNLYLSPNIISIFKCRSVQGGGQVW